MTPPPLITYAVFGLEGTTIDRLQDMLIISARPKLSPRLIKPSGLQDVTMHTAEGGGVRGGGGGGWWWGLGDAGVEIDI